MDRAKLMSLAGLALASLAPRALLESAAAAADLGPEERAALLDRVFRGGGGGGGGGGGPIALVWAAYYSLSGVNSHIKQYSLLFG
jgi:hypothetical protein